MTGFYSKDFILESAYGQFYFSSTVVYFIATIGAMFTTLYSVKVLYLTFLTNPAGPQVNYKIAHEGDIFMSLPLIILAFFSIFFGYITKDIFIGLGSGFFADNGLFIHPSHEIMLDTEFAVPVLFKLLPLMFTISLTIFSIILSEFYPKLLIYFKFSRFGYNMFSFFNQRFYVELFYNRYITDAILNLGGQTSKVLDKGSIELIGPFGLEKGLVNLSKSIANLDTGVITSYALYILIGLISYILVPYISNNNLLIIILFGLFVLVSDNLPKLPNTIQPLKSGFIFPLLRNIPLFRILFSGLLVGVFAFALRYLCFKILNIDVLNDLGNLISFSYFTLVGMVSALTRYIFFDYPLVKPNFSNMQALSLSKVAKAIRSLFQPKNMLGDKHMVISMHSGEIENSKLAHISFMESNAGNSTSNMETSGNKRKLSESSFEEDNSEFKKTKLTHDEVKEVSSSSNLENQNLIQSSGSETSDDSTENQLEDTQPSVEFFAPLKVNPRTASVEQMLDVSDMDYLDRVNGELIHSVLSQMSPEEIAGAAPRFADNLECSVYKLVNSEIQSIEHRSWSDEDKDEVINHLNTMSTAGIGMIKNEVLHQANRILQENEFPVQLNPNREHGEETHINLIDELESDQESLEQDNSQSEDFEQDNSQSEHPTGENS